MKNLTKLFVSLCFVAMIFTGEVYGQQSLTTITGWNAYVHLPANYATSGKTYPTIIFFPGLGEVGTSAPKVIRSGPGAYITQGWNGNVVVDGNTVEFIVISLQTASAYPSESRMNQAIQSIKNLYRVDNNRLYLTGLSHGGWCSSTFVSGDPYGGPYTYASQIAAVVTVQGVRPDDNSPYPNLFDNYANAGGRYLGFEQRLDNRDTKTVVDRMNATKPNSAIFVPTNFGGGGHCCWEQFYGGSGTQPGNFNLDGISQNIYQWLARQSLNGAVPPPPANIPPVSNAGSDKTITLPVNNSTLNGSGTDANGTIISYNWTLYYGPSPVSISNASSANASVSGMVQGVYEFDMVVTDNNGATATDRMKITVNAAAVIPNSLPTANAGADKVITLPANSVTITGSGADTDGTITVYSWSKVSGPSSGNITNATSPTATFSNLSQGLYQYQLKVTDNRGGTATDNVQVTVNAAIPVPNQAPVANAGVDKSITLPINSITLNGTGTDADGTVVSYRWELFYGPNFATISNSNNANATAGNLIAGTYDFDLTVTDNNGATATDRIQITVNPASGTTNQLPVANAGADKIITLPTNNLTISGSGTDADGTISAYAWTKVSGPSTGTMSNTATASVSLTGLTEGVYQYQLQVTDNIGATATDNVQLTVNAAGIPPSTSKTVKVRLYSGSSPYNTAQWNNWNIVSNHTSSFFKFDDGATSTVKAKLTSGDRMTDNGSSYAAGAVTAPGPVLRFNSAQTSNRDLTISGLSPAKQYSIEFYASRAATGNKTVYSIGNLKDTINTDNNLNDIAKFINISPDNSGKVVISLSRIGTWNYLAGFTVIEETSTGRMASVATSNQPIIAMASPVITGNTTASILQDVSTSVRVYPNPFMNTIQIDLGVEITGKYTINLIDISGKVLITKNGEKRTASQVETMNATSLSYGIYFLEIISNGKRAVHKLKKIQATQY